MEENQTREEVRRWGVVYLLDGNFHRENGPAKIGFEGQEAWLIKDRYYRKNSHSVLSRDGTMFYEKDGKARAWQQ